VLVDWRTLLKLPTGAEEARLTGSHYFGLGMRFVRSMDKNGTFVLSESDEGEVVRGDEKLYRGRWCAYTANVEGKTVTVAIFSHTGNRRATTWFTMKDPFAFLSATMNLHKAPVTLKAGQRISLVYGIAAWDGKIEPAQIERTYQLWLQLHAVPSASPPRE